MAKVTIFVSVIEGTKQLTFADSKGKSGKDITTECECTDKIEWKAQTEGLEIVGIPMKPGTPGIWSENKAPVQKNNGDWVGTICETAAGKTAGYSVEYTINGSETLTQDPKIHVER